MNRREHKQIWFLKKPMSDGCHTPLVKVTEKSVSHVIFLIRTGKNFMLSAQMLWIICMMVFLTLSFVIVSDL